MSASNKWTQLAIKMLQKFGRTDPVTFYRRAAGSYDPATLGYADDSLTAVFTVDAAPVDYTLMQQKEYTIEDGNKLLYIPGVDTSGVAIVPEIGDIVTLEKDYQVKSVEKYETTSLDVAYRLEIGDGNGG